MSDYAVFVQDQARVYLGGPPLVKMAIDEDADEEELGGAEMHSRISGLSDYLAARRARRDPPRPRRSSRHLNWQQARPGTARPPTPPRYDPDELLGIASRRRAGAVRRPRGHRAASSTARGSTSSSRCTARSWSAAGRTICGFPVGILANNGILFSEEAQKGAQFIQLCNRSDTPLLFLQNITGFMVGTQYEQGGIIKHGAKLINAVSNSTVPHLTLMVGATLRRRQLRHVRPGVRPAVRVHVAQPPHRGDGPQAAGRRDVDRPARRPPSGPAGTTTSRPMPTMRDAIEAQIERRVDRAVRHGAAVGRRHHRPARHPHGARASRCPPCTPRRSRAPSRSACSGM